MPWPQKLAVFRGQGWHLDPHSPVLINISADKRPFNQLTVKNLFCFHYSSKHFAFNTIILFMKKQLIWVLEWRKSVHYWWSCILFSPECTELTSMLDPLLNRWGVPPVIIRCVHWTMQMWVLQTWIKAQGLVIVMFCFSFVLWIMKGLSIQSAYFWWNKDYLIHSLFCSGYIKFTWCNRVECNYNAVRYNMKLHTTLY